MKFSETNVFRAICFQNVSYFIYFHRIGTISYFHVFTYFPQEYLKSQQVAVLDEAGWRDL